MSAPRSGAAAVQLNDGRILITGGMDANGVPQATAEVYDPSTGVFTASPAMSVPRANHAAIVLKNGDVLVTGGLTTGGNYSDSAEIYSISRQQWTLLQSSIGTGRARHVMAMLSDGNILIAGGTSTTILVDSIVLFKANEQIFTPIGVLLTPRTGAAAAATPDGRVLIVGGIAGNGAVLASTEIFVYSKDTMTGTMSAGPLMASPRVDATATSTYDGVAVIGGNDGQNDLGTAEIFSQWTNTFRLVKGGRPRSQHFAALLPNNGGILAMGGTGGAAVDLLQPWANNKTGAIFTPPISLFNLNEGFAAPASLGLLLVAGGMGSYANVAELYWFPTIATDKPDYKPGTPVEMTGTGFQPFETVNLHLHEWVNQTIEDEPDASAVADSLGNFIYDGYAPDAGDLGARYHLTAVGMSSSYQAQTIFTDGTTAIAFTNGSLNQQAGTCGQLTLASNTDNGSYDNITLQDGVFGNGSGTFYTTQANCNAQTNAITSIAGANLVSVWYRNNTAGNPVLYAYTSGLLGCLGGATCTSQTEFITSAATQLVFAVQPGGGLPGAVWAQQPIVVVQDANHNTVTANTDSIRLVITTGFNPGAGTLTCASDPLNADHGIASFSGCWINNKAGTCYELTASDVTNASITPATSGCFYIANPATADNSTVTANPTSVADNGTTTSTITVTLKDSTGSPVAGKAVALTPSGGRSIISAASGVSNASGVVTFTVRDSVAEQVTYTAIDTTDGITVTQTATVTFTLGTVSDRNSTVVANPTNNVLANGTATSTITVTLVDGTNNPVPNKTVTLSGNTGSHSTIVTVSGTTNASGVATFTVTDLSAETVTYTARDTTDSITVRDTAQVTFTAIATTLTLTTPSPNVVSRGSTSLVTLTATLTSGGSGLAGATVSFTVDGAGVTCQAGSSTTTNASGVATCLYNPSSLSTNNHTVRSSSTQFTTSSGTYASASSSSQTLTVRTAPTMSWTTAPPASAVYNTTFSVAATSNSGGTITYSVNGVCTINAQTVTMTSGTGTCTVTASVPATGSYGPGTLNATVNAALATQATLTVTGVPATPVGLGAQFTVGTSGGSGTGAVTFAVTGICSIAGADVTITGATGSCTVTATKASDGNYKSASASATAWASAAVVTITNLSQTFTGSPLPVTVTTVPTGLSVAVEYTGIDVTYGPTSTAPTNVGHYTVTATVTSPGYTGFDTETETIAPIAPGLVLVLHSGTPEPSPYGMMVEFDLSVGVAPCPTGTVQWFVDDTAVGSPVTLDRSCSPVIFQTATLEPTPVGQPHRVYAAYSGDGSHDPGNSNVVTHGVATDATAVNLTTTATTLYVGQSVTFTATVTIPGVSPDPSANIPTGTVQFFDGTTLLDTQTLPSTSPYQVAFTTSSLAAGSHSITATFVSTDPTEFPGSSSAVKVTTVNLIPPQINWTAPGSIVYGTALSATQLNATVTDPINNGITVPGTLTYIPPAGTVLPVGPANLQVNFTPDDPATYATQSMTVTLTVTASTLTVTADNQTRPYGASNPTLTYTITGFVNGDSQASAVTGAPACSTTATATSTVTGSPYLITCTQGTLAANNYSFTFVSGNLTVTATAPTLSLTCTEVTYDGNPHSCVGTAVGVDGVTPVNGGWVYSPASETAAGSYPVTGTFTSSDTNYQSDGTATGTLIIDQAAVTLTAGSYFGIYDGASHATLPLCAVTGAYTVGLSCTNSPASVGPPVGTGAVTPAVSGNTSNFAITDVNGTWDIARAMLTVTADDKTRAYGASNPALTYAISDFVGSDTSAVVSGTATCTTAATATSAVGTYPIICTLGSLSATNYSFQFVPGTLTITTAAVTATAGSYSGVYDCATHAPSACVVSGTFTGTLSCTNNPTPVGPGVNSGTVTPVVSGDTLTNYSITPVNGNWSITKASSTTTVTCPVSVVYTGAAQTPCSATVTGAGGLNQSLTVSYSNNTNAGTATASATYAGDANHSSSSDSATFTINPAPAVVTLSNLAQYYTGSPLPVTVTTVPPGLSLQVLYSSPTYPSSTTAPTATGSYTVTATVTNPNYVGQDTGTLVIYPGSSGINLVLHPGTSEPSLYGATVQFDLLQGGTPCPTGTVQFYVDGVAAGSPVTLSGSSCSSPVTFLTATLEPGTHGVYAIYSGDTLYAGGQSNTVSHTVSANTSNVTLTASQSPINVGQLETLIALVIPNPKPDPGAKIPTGSVQFWDGTTLLGTTALGTTYPYTAVFNTTSLAAGTHSLVATYVSTDGTEYPGSSSTVLVTVEVGKIVPTITWPTPAPIVCGVLLSATQLNATAADTSIPGVTIPLNGGNYAYIPAAGTLVAVGTTTLNVTFTPSTADSPKYTPVTGTVQLTVTPATPTLSLTCTEVTYNGNSHTCSGTATGVVGGAAVTGTWVFNPANETAAGTYTITGTFTSTNSNYLGGTATGTLKIDPAPVTATSGSYNGVYDGATHTIPACAVTGAYTDGLSCTNTPASVGPGVGSGTVTPGVTGGTLTNFAITTVDGTWSITQASTTVALTCPASVTYNGVAQTPCTATVTGAGGLSQVLTVNYTNNTNAGTATASASYAGDANHAASSNSTTFTIAPAPVTATAGSYSGLYDGTTHATAPACAVTGPYKGALTCANNPATVGPGVGSGAVTPSVTGASSNFTITLVEGAWSITQATSAVAVTCPTSVTFNGVAQTPCSARVTGVGGLSQILTVAYSNNINAGTATASASYAGDTNHAASSGSATFTIAPAPVTATAGSFSGVYNGATRTPSACAVTGAYTGTLTCTNNPASVGPAVGSGTVTPTVNGSTTNFTVTSVNGAWSITQATSAVAVTCPTSVTYNGTAQTPCSARVTGAGGLSQTLTVTYGNNTNAGTATASASYPGDTNHAASSGSTTFTIARAPVTATAGSYSGVYNGATHTPTACALTGTYTTGLSCTNNPASVGPGVGSGTVTPTVTGGTSNFTITSVNGAWSITSAALTVTASNQTRTYGAANPTLTYAITGFVGSDTSAVVSGAASCTTTATATSPVGTYPITCTAGSLSAANYSFQFAAGTLAITAAPVTVTAGSYTGTYDGTTHAPSACVVTGAYTTGLSCTDNPASVGPGVGLGAVTPTPAVSGGGSLSNFAITSVNGAWNIGRAALTVTASNQARTYGAANPTLTYAITGFVGGDTSAVVSGAASCTTTATVTSDVGTYPITCTAGNLAAANYSFQFSPGTLTITAASVTATAGSYSGAYDGATHTVPACTLTGAYTTGLSCTNNPSPVGPDIGSGTVTPTVTGGSSNFTITTVNGAWSIGRAALTVTASNQTRLYGAANPTLTYAITGFVGGDTSAVVSGAASCTTTATATSPVGTYPITCTAGNLAAANYSFQFAAGTLTITAASVTATAGSYTGVYDGSSHAPSACTLTGAYTAGLSCTNNPSPVGPDIGTGTVTPTVSGTGLTNFTITSVSGSWSITQAASTVTVSCPTSVAYNGTAQTPCTATVTGAGGLSQSLTVSYTNNTTPGTATASASFAGDTNHPAASNSATFTIARAAVTATAGSYNGIYNGAAHAPSACAVTGAYTGGLTCSNSPASVGPGVGAGTVTPTVNGSATNFTVTSVNGSWSITQAPATVTLSNLAQYYTGSPLPVTVTTIPTGLGVTVLYDGSATAPTNPGSYTVVATVTNPNYVGQDTETLVIYPASSGLTLQLRSGMPEPSPYGTMSYFDLSLGGGTACPTGTVQFYVDGTASGSAVTLNGNSCAAPLTFQTATLEPGSHSVYAAYSGDTLHAAGNSNTVTHGVSANATSVALATSATTVNVGQPVSFTATVTPPALDPSAHVPAGTVEFFDGATSLGVITLSSSAPYTAVLTTSSLASGAHSISATYTSSNGEFTGSSSAVAVTVTVDKIVPTINWSNPASIVYGTALSAPQLNATATDPTTKNPVAGAFVYTPAAGTVLPVGTVNLKVDFTPTDTTNYSAQSATVSLTVTAATPTLSLTCTEVVYDGNPHSCVGKAIGVDGATAVAGSWVYSPASETAVGSYPVTGTFTSTDSNYQGGTATGTLKIDATAVTPTTTTVSCPASVAYNGAAQTPCTATVTGAGGLNQSLTVSYANNTNAGTATASASYPGDSTYGASSNSASFTVNPAAVTATAGSYSGAYDASSHTPTACAVTGAYTTGLSCIDAPASVGPAVGSGTVTPTVSGGTTNFTVTSVNGSWSITQATSAVAVICPASVVYSGAAQTPCTATVTGAGGLSQTLAVNYTNNTNAGTATAGASFAGDNNHAAGSNSASFTIDLASQAIDFTQPTSPVVYGVAPMSLSAKGGESGKPVVFSVDASSTGSAMISGSTLTIMGVGNINVNADQAGDSNHRAAPRVTRTIVVHSATLTIAANNASRVYGANNPPFSGSVTGALNGDTFSESYSTTATITSNVGTYPIVPSVAGANLNNYAMTVQNGTLTITQAGTVTSVNAGSSSVNPGQSVTLTARVLSATTGTPTGSITFYDGTTLLGTVPLTAGAAALSTSSLTAGTTNVLNAVYSGDTNFTTSNSSTSISVGALDFTLAVSGANSRTVLQGNSATYQVAVTPLYGTYPGTVSFTASGHPSGASITFNPATIAINGGNQMVTVTVQTPAQAKLELPESGRKLAPLALALLLIPLFGARRLRRQGSRLSRLASIVLLLGCTLAGVVMTGCGSQSGIFTQTEKNYTINVTATSGNVQRTVPVTLVIQ